jgi:hypothetical protein
MARVGLRMHGVHRHFNVIVAGQVLQRERGVCDIKVRDAGARVVRARNSGNMDVRGRQAMAEFTLARFCPHRSMAPVLAIMRLAAAASKEAA